jgi:hypothetical protein
MADDENFAGNFTLARQTGWGRGSGGTWGRFFRSFNTNTISAPKIPIIDISHVPIDTTPQIDFSANPYSIGKVLMIMAGFALLCLAAVAGFWLISSFTVWPAWIKYACIGIACLAAAPPVFIGLAFVAEFIGIVIEGIIGLIQLLFGLAIVAGVGYLAFIAAF